MKEVFKFGFTLGIICLLAGGVLAVVHEVTEPQILKQRHNAEEKALREVFPEAVSFEPVVTETQKTLYYRVLTKQNQLAGFVLKVETKGYASTIELLCALDVSLRITNLKVLAQNETPGLGTKITESFFLNRFLAKSSLDIRDIETLSGATISSSAVIQAVYHSLSDTKELLLQDVSTIR